MRVTNIMMTTNMLGNITRNKADMNSKFNQYSTGQKIQKPSEDPVVAVRSLKYRANLTELEQYIDKNIPDAFEWMNVTESALDNMNELMTEMYSYCTQGSQDTYETIDRDSIIRTMQQYKEQIYECLNADYAGRYVFSGYRTDTSVCYEGQSTDTEYKIKEPLTFQNVYTKDFVIGGARYQEGTSMESYKQMAPTKGMVYCLDLSYGDIETMTSLTYVNQDGDEVSLMDSFDFRELNSTDVGTDDEGAVSSPYSIESNEVVFLRDTGELLLSTEAYEALRTSRSISSNYVKNTFNKGDLRPEMYFDCVRYSLVEDEDTGEMIRRTDEDGEELGINYTKPRDQDIYYEVNFSQNLKVNTMANETLNGTFAKVIDDIMTAVNDAYNTQQEIDNVDILLARTDNTDDVTEALTALREQLETELTLKKSMMQKAFSNGMAGVKEAQDGTKAANDDGTISKISVSIATTSLGSRYTRLQLIEGRLTEQKTSFTEILTNNECVNIEDAIINFNAAENTYNASLSAASKVVQNSLLDFL